ncbi:MAG TPA: Ku protein [Solirubrobacteraceae bacterium]|jgi:DNA end-binding protein Ku|nr:Ku protein [Solirubrobacteraceae bacterium]
MARALWSGSLSFGLVNVPVVLYSAVRDRSVHFSQLHEPDGSPIQTRRVCSLEDREVPYSEIAKGYEMQDGSWVLLSDDDLAAAAPRKSHTIDIEAFVEECEIDPIYLDRPYLLAPENESAARAYALLGEAMGDSGKVALGRFVMRAKEHLVSIRPQGELLTLTTMRFHDEVRSSADVATEIDVEAVPGSEQVENAIAIIEELEVPFEPTRYRDEHRAHLQRVIKRKQKGQKISAPRLPAKKPTPTAPDLMGALEQSLARIRGERPGAGKKQTKKTRAAPPASRPSGSSAKRSS